MKQTMARSRTLAMTVRADASEIIFVLFEHSSIALYTPTAVSHDFMLYCLRKPEQNITRGEILYNDLFCLVNQ